MKKSLIALAAVAAIGSASAQSTVTISGVMDAGYVYTKEVAIGAANGNVTRGNNNRINFSVAEDLGGGMRAVANVGMRFEPATGLAESGGVRPLFQGETRVGVSGGFGTILFGRGLAAVQGPNGGYADPWGVTTVAGSVYAPGFATDYAGGGEGRIDTAIFYTAPTIGGLTLSASYSPRKVALTSGYSKTHSGINAIYAAGPLAIGGGVENNRAGDSFTDIYGTYDLGVAKLFANWGTVKGGTAAERAGITFAAGASAVPTGTGSSQVAPGGKIDTWAIGAAIPMGNTSFRVGYSTWNGNGAPGQKDDTKLGLGVRQNLSKRTYLYSDIAFQTRKNMTGSVTAASNTANTRQTFFDLGVAHSF